jgi:cell division protein FtsL
MEKGHLRWPFYLAKTNSFYDKMCLGGITMLTVILIVSVIIVLVVLLLAVLTTSKAYTYKHTIDPISDQTENESNEKKDSTD